MRNYDPADEMLGGFTTTDGTIEFYNRINALLQPGFKVLDLGAGRGAWCWSISLTGRRSSGMSTECSNPGFIS